MEAWLLLIVFGAAGAMYVSPLVAQVIAKVAPSSTGTTQTILSGVATALGVILAIYVGREIFKGKVKEV